MLCHISVSPLHGFPPPFLLLLSSQFVLFASHHPQISALLPREDCLLLEFFIGAHDDEGVVDEALLDVQVQRRIC